MKYGIAKSFAILFVAAMAGVTFAADKQVEELLAHMRGAYKSVKAATYKCTVTVWNAQSEQTVIDVDMAYKSPDLMRAILKNKQIPGGALTIISDGQHVTNSLTGSSNPYTMDEIEKEVPSNLESICFWDWDRQLSTEAGKNMATSTFRIEKDANWDGKKWTILEETAKKDNVLCRYYIDPKTFFIWRTHVSYLDSGKDEMDCKLTSLDTKADLSDATFKGA